VHKGRTRSGYAGFLSLVSRESSGAKLSTEMFVRPKGTMTTAAAPDHRPQQDSAVIGEKRAVRFFWVVLILATGASVAGNVTHAVLEAAAGTVLIAAAAALVPPTVLLGATHSVALLVRTRAGSGFTYWCALSMTLALALCAFVLSFDALRALAITAGIDRRLAWLWPLVIDVSIAQATMALLALTARHHRYRPSGMVAGPASGRRSRVTRDDGYSVGGEPVERKGAAGTGSPDRLAPTKRAAALTVADVARRPTHVTNGVVAESHWRKVADVLVRERRTKIEPALVAQVLAMTEARTPPSTIGRRLKVHHTSVRRIQQAAAELTS
jgi:hypothetical protein